MGEVNGMNESVAVAGGVFGGLAALILGLVGFVFVLLWFVGTGVIHNKLCWKHPNLFPVLTILLFFVNPIGIMISVFAISAKSNKMREEAYNSMIADPSDRRVDELIEFLNRYKCPNDPNSWHRLRGVWYACNQSDNISVAKKEELKTFLLMQGLYLNRDEAQIKH